MATILETAAGAGVFTTLLAAVDAAGLRGAPPTHLLTSSIMRSSTDPMVSLACEDGDAHQPQTQSDAGLGSQCRSASSFSSLVLLVLVLLLRGYPYCRSWTERDLNRKTGIEKKQSLSVADVAVVTRR